MGVLEGFPRAWAPLGVAGGLRDAWVSFPTGWRGCALPGFPLGGGGALRALFGREGALCDIRGALRGWRRLCRCPCALWGNGVCWSPGVGWSPGLWDGRVPFWGKGRMSVTPWFCSGSGGLCRSPFGSRGCFAGHLGPLWVGDGSASTSTLLGAVGVCWGLGSLYGSGEESLWDPWLPFVGGCSARRFDIPRGPLSEPGWVGVTPLGWWVGSAGPLHLAQPRTHTTLGSTRGVRRGLSASPTTSQSPAPCGSRPC